MIIIYLYPGEQHSSEKTRLNLFSQNIVFCQNKVPSNYWKPFSWQIMLIMNYDYGVYSFTFGGDMASRSRILDMDGFQLMMWRCWETSNGTWSLVSWLFLLVGTHSIRWRVKEHKIDHVSKNMLSKSQALLFQSPIVDSSYLFAFSILFDMLHVL